MKFTVEDIGKVVVTTSTEFYPFKSAVLCSLGKEKDGIIGVEVEDGLHDCGGDCEVGSGFWVFEADFEFEGGDGES